MFAAAFARFALATLAAALGLALWNLQSRGPRTLANDAIEGLRHPRSIVFGLLRVAGGALLLASTAIVVVRAMPPVSTETDTVAVCAVSIAGLLIDALAGDDLRKALHINR